MSETENNATTETQVQQPKVASVGKIQKVEMAFPDTTTQAQQSTAQAADQNINTGGADAINSASNGAADANANGAPAPAITDAQLKEYFAAQGIDYEGLDKLKEKLTAPTSTVETPEQVQAKELAREKRIVDKFISGGGTYDQYTALKSVANADVAELSKNTLKKELKDAGFSETEVDGIIKERYYQFAEEDLDQFDEESDKDFAKRKKEYGDKILSNRSLPIKKQAEGILAGIQEAINSEDLHAQNELTLSANIDEQFKTLSRKDTYEIGDINGKAIEPIESEVPESVLAEVRDTLKDPSKRQQFLETPDGSLNITNITNVLVENAKLKAALKVSYHEGSTRTNAAWEKVFPARSASEIGVGGSNAKANGQNGVKIPTSVGKVQRVQPQR